MLKGELEGASNKGIRSHRGELQQNKRSVFCQMKESHVFRNGSVHR